MPARSNLRSEHRLHKSVRGTTRRPVRLGDSQLSSSSALDATSGMPIGQTCKAATAFRSLFAYPISLRCAHPSFASLLSTSADPTKEHDALQGLLALVVVAEVGRRRQGGPVAESPKRSA